MSRSAKPLQSLDLEIVDVLQSHLERLGVSRNQAAIAAGVGNNRAGKIFRKESPGITAGEIFLFSEVIGVPASEIVAEAEARLGNTPTAHPANVAELSSQTEDDDALPDFTLLAARTVTHRPGWDAASAHDTAGEESQDY